MTEFECETNVINHAQPAKRPKTTHGTTEKVTTGCGNLYVTKNRDSDGHPIEVFAHLGKTGQCGAAQLEALCRCISIGLRTGVPVESYIKQLQGIRCPSKGMDEGVEILSCADAIATVLKKE